MPHESHPDRDPNFNLVAPDYAWWAVHAFWSADEAAALAVEIDPRRLDLVGSVRWARVSDARTVICKAQAVGHLAEKIWPCDFVDWARGRIELPMALVEAVSAAPKPLHPKRSDAQHGLHPKERLSLLKAVLASAVHHFGHDPDDVRPNSTARRMADAYAAAGYPLSEDTLRKFLREAAEQVSRSNV